MKCKNCGNELREQDVFCSQCGIKVKEDKDEIDYSKANLLTIISGLCIFVFPTLLTGLAIALNYRGQYRSYISCIPLIGFTILIYVRSSFPKHNFSKIFY